MNSLEDLVDTKIKITLADGTTFNPLRELVFLELNRRNHSPQYIKEVLEKGITVDLIKYKDTKLTAMRIVRQNYYPEILFTFNLVDIKNQPYWLVEKLKEWNFDLTFWAQK